MAKNVVLFLAWIASFFFFSALTSGITSTNDGSHYALTRSLYEQGSAALGEFSRYAGHDFAVYQDRAFSDRNPGLSFLATTYLYVTDPLIPWVSTMYSDHFASIDVDGPGMVWSRLSLLAPALGASAAVLVFLWLSELRVGALVSLAVSLAFALGTLAFRYSTVFYSHILATVLTILLLRHMTFFLRNEIPRSLAMASFFWGYLVITEYIAVLLIFPLVFLLWPRIHRRPRLLIPCLTAAGPILLLMIYNASNFSGFFDLAHFHHATFAYHHKISDTFEFHMALRNLLVLWFNLDNSPFTSFFRSSWFWFLIPAISVLRKLKIVKRAEDRRFEIFLLLGFLTASFSIASFVGHYGGYDLDYRQMLFGVPFLLPLLARMLDAKETLHRLILLATLLSALYLSVNLQYEHIRHLGQRRLTVALPSLEAASVNVPLITAWGLLFFFLIFGLIRFGIRPGLKKLGIKNKFLCL